MRSKTTIHSMSRRTFGKFVAIGVGAGTALSQVTSGLARSLPTDETGIAVYSFYPMEYGSITKCKACLSHAEHKRFATREAAEANRAHAGCNCTILMTPATNDEYLSMFGGSVNSVDRLVFDLRWSIEP